MQNGVFGNGEVVSVRLKSSKDRAKQMHSKRIVQIQKRAKRRFIALAIVAAAFVGYSSRSLFGAEDQLSPLPIAKKMATPVVKAVGIRLINPNGNTLTAGTSSGPQLQSLPQPPSQALTTMPPNDPVPTLLPQSTANAYPAALALTPSLPPAPACQSKPSQPASGFSLLPTPPRMSEVLTDSPKGKVVMKLGSGSEASSHFANNPKPTQTMTVAESADIQVTPTRPLGQPAKMPPFLFEKSVQKVKAFNEESGSTSVQSAVRVSFADDNSQTSTNATEDQKTNSPAQPKNRAPQLVKLKPTQLGHMVVLAQSTDLDVTTAIEQPEELVPKVEVDASLVPSSISKGLIGSSQEIGGNSKSESIAKAIVSDTVEDAFISFVPPQVPSSTNGTSNTERMDVGTKNDASGQSFQLDAPDVIEPIDKSRRSFDSRMTGQAPNATVELECLTAASMDLPGKLTALAVQDESVCKALQSGRSISLVGNQVGTTLVQIWTSELGDSPQVIRVNVAHSRGKVQATRNEFKDIKQVIAQGFPRADVNIISNEDGSIEVRGTTDSEESARRILELVRKLYLVPVKDKLAVTR